MSKSKSVERGQTVRRNAQDSGASSGVDAAPPTPSYWQIPPVEPLTPDLLRHTIDPGDIECESTRTLEPLKEITTQQRAIHALRFGLGIRSPGFNCYVAGPPGTGKMTAVETLLQQRATREPTPSDWCYLNSFADPSRPRVLQLPAGSGAELSRDMEAMIERARNDIPQAFSNEEYTNRQEQIGATVAQAREKLFRDLSERVHTEGFLLQTSPVGLLLVPVIGGKPLSDQEFMALPEEERDELRERREGLEGEVRSVVKRVRLQEKDGREQLRGLDREVALFVVEGLIEDLAEKYRDHGAVVSFLQEVQEDIIEHVAQFRKTDQEQQEGGVPFAWAQEASFRKYQVNVIIDNSGSEGAPVVVELNPTYRNLFGAIGREVQLGALATDFTLIRGGSLHQANGGYLVLPVEEVLRNPWAYDGLKRALRAGEMTVDDLGERLGMLETKTPRPDAVPLDVKVILVGGSDLYYRLHALDDDFQELFKVKAEFDGTTDLDYDNLCEYVRVIGTICHKENLAHLDRTAIARVVEHGLRLAADQQRLSTRYAEIADILREAAYWASEEGANGTEVAHVERAIEQRTYRSNLIEERMRETIERGTVLIDTAGEMVGQVNGLSVLSMGDYAFGRPSRITAAVGLGRGGVVDIEREARLGGPLHTKGVLILGGYLTEQYAQNAPLSLSARLVFEQSYGGVDGDSASAAELCSLLSALAEVPIKQSLAITGSVNQHGHMQAIGGVNQKVEGFFDLCYSKGLTGEQGVLIPASNVQHLMLRQDVVDAVQQGLFRVSPVASIDEAVALLCGVEAGERQDDGSFPAGTMHDLVHRRLQALSQRLSALSRSDGYAGPPPDPASDDVNQD